MSRIYRRSGVRTRNLEKPAVSTPPPGLGYQSKLQFFLRSPRSRDCRFYLCFQRWRWWSSQGAGERSSTDGAAPVAHHGTPSSRRRRQGVEGVEGLWSTTPGGVRLGWTDALASLASWPHPWAPTWNGLGPPLGTPFSPPFYSWPCWTNWPTWGWCRL